MPAKQNLAILGSTGSVGVNTLDVVARHPGMFRIAALTARNQVDLLFEQCCNFKPMFAVMLEPAAAAELERRVKGRGLECTVLCGPEALEQAVSLPQVDTVMAAIVGIAGLRPTLAAAQAGKKVLLANKESLVTAGPVLTRAVRDNGASLLPIDSEHNAIFQALPRGYSGKPGAAGVRRVLLTASGGPFRAAPPHRLEHVTPDEACAHPNWVMGRKISVDSATMMNKGLEVIEAHWLFQVEEEQIEVLVHPESVIHSLVEYIDGSVIAQLGNPDMRTPIAFALGYPERIAAGVEFLDLARIGALHFEQPDLKRFPCLRLAYSALRAGGSAPTALNAANEIAVENFLAGRLSFTRIPALIEAVLEQLPLRPIRCIDDVLGADQEARACAERWLKGSANGVGVGNLSKLVQS
ncbi:MAG: 1-deoxy-D-xylulose-5-phosphate reductoisomerase [Betaproteobacteria bacterium]|nr:1-deoxy-D-xylulose-5-phosphate reductoisomerase [Betaproteobacteria bacterium]